MPGITLRYKRVAPTTITTIARWCPIPSIPRTWQCNNVRKCVQITNDHFHIELCMGWHGVCCNIQKHIPSIPNKQRRSMRESLAVATIYRQHEQKPHSILSCFAFCCDTFSWETISESAARTFALRYFAFGRIVENNIQILSISFVCASPSPSPHLLRQSSVLSVGGGWTDWKFPSWSCFNCERQDAAIVNVICDNKKSKNSKVFYELYGLLSS